MKLRTIVVGAAMCLFSLTLCFADNAMMGTWKLNEAKSKIPVGAAKSVTVTYAAAGDSVKCTIDGVDGKGSPTHTEWTGKFDGKDYPVTGDPNQTTRSVKPITDHKFAVDIKKDGKVTMSGHIEIAADGKSRTVALTGTDASGKKVTSKAVYDKQ
ncbi:MAG TPA: hypothetical protein VL983_07015 [Terriglobales bacterium]|nr:hypothetical protein [Terriglobales bacterium]